MNSILTIQDLSCVGRCSLTVALPVLSAMGCQCSVLPTAVLSTHTGFPDPEIIPLTDHIPSIGKHFASIGVRFDAVTVGYLADPAQAEAVLSLLRHYKAQGSQIIVDPAMGDHGKLYRGLPADHVSAMLAVCREADVILPNVTEACLLTGIPYQELSDPDFLQKLTRAMLEIAPAAVITGVSGKAGSIGFCGGCPENHYFCYETAVIPRQFHGTGDLFAAVFSGGLLDDKSVYDAAAAAADFVKLCVVGTESVTPYGVEFENQLPRLMKG